MVSWQFRLIGSDITEVLTSNIQNNITHNFCRISSKNILLSNLNVIYIKILHKNIRSRVCMEEGLRPHGEYLIKALFLRKC